MKHILALCLCAVPWLLTGCGSAAFYAKTKSGAEVGVLVPGLLAKQTAKDVELTTPSGVHMKVAAYASRQPDPAVTGVVSDAVKWNSPLARAAGTALVKRTADPNVIPRNPNVIPKDPNVIPADPNVIPLNPNR